MSSELQSKIDSLEAQLHHKTQEVAGLRVEVEREHTERKRAEDMRVKLEVGHVHRLFFRENNCFLEICRMSLPLASSLDNSHSTFLFLSFVHVYCFHT